MRSIVGRRISSSIRTDFAVDALVQALYACQSVRDSYDNAFAETINGLYNGRLLNPDTHWSVANSTVALVFRGARRFISAAL